MSGFSKTELERRLEDLTITAKSINTLCMWLIQHRIHFQAIVRIWFKKLVNASKNRKLAYMYLVDDVLQTSKKEHLEYVSEFGDYIYKVFEHLVTVNLDGKSKDMIGMLIKTWRMWNLFDEKRQQYLEKTWKEATGFEGNPLKRTESLTSAHPDPPAKKQLRLRDIATLKVCENVLSDNVLENVTQLKIDSAVATSNSMDGLQPTPLENKKNMELHVNGEEPFQLAVGSTGTHVPEKGKNPFTVSTRVPGAVQTPYNMYHQGEVWDGYQWVNHSMHQHDWYSVPPPGSVLYNSDKKKNSWEESVQMFLMEKGGYDLTNQNIPRNYESSKDFEMRKFHTLEKEKEALKEKVNVQGKELEDIKRKHMASKKETEQLEKEIREKNLENNRLRLESVKAKNATDNLSVGDQNQRIEKNEAKSALHDTVLKYQNTNAKKDQEKASIIKKDLVECSKALSTEEQKKKIIELMKKDSLAKEEQLCKLKKNNVQLKKIVRKFREKLTLSETENIKNKEEKATLESRAKLGEIVTTLEKEKEALEEKVSQQGKELKASKQENERLEKENNRLLVASVTDKNTMANWSKLVIDQKQRIEELEKEKNEEIADATKDNCQSKSGQKELGNLKSNIVQLKKIGRNFREKLILSETENKNIKKEKTTVELALKALKKEHEKLKYSIDDHSAKNLAGDIDCRTKDAAFVESEEREKKVIGSLECYIKNETPKKQGTFYDNKQDIEREGTLAKPKKQIVMIKEKADENQAQPAIRKIATAASSTVLPTSNCEENGTRTCQVEGNHHDLKLTEKDLGESNSSFHAVYECKICNISVTGKTGFGQHLGGKKHAIRARKIQKKSIARKIQKKNKCPISWDELLQQAKAQSLTGFSCRW